MRYRFLRFPNGRERAVTFSYDDGNRADLKLLEIINKYNMKCTFNLNNDILRANENVIKDDEVRELVLKNGHEVAVHGEMHRAPGMQRPIDGIKEVLNNRLELEKKYGGIIRGMAYPDSGIRIMQNGASYETIKGYLKNLDIAYSRTLGNDNDEFLLPADWYAWMPTCHHANPKIFEYIDKFLSFNFENMYGSNRFPRLFYMWGHSYEFNNADNWDLLEKICQKLGDNDNIWYATNMEIYNYVTAYNSLVYSADEKTIYNPTLYTIWFDIDGKGYKINSGEILTI